MKDKLTLDVGLALDLKNAFRRNNWSEGEIKELTKGTFLRDVRKAMLGHAEIKPLDHVIDCDSDPFRPDGWTVEEHKEGGQLKFDLNGIGLYLSKRQRSNEHIDGHVGGIELRKELENQPVLNANVLDYLLAHPELIPDEWKGKYVFFWGTVYRSHDGRLYVRCLCWASDRWSWFCNRLVSDWHSVNQAAVRAS